MLSKTQKSFNSDQHLTAGHRSLVGEGSRPVSWKTEIVKESRRLTLLLLPQNGALTLLFPPHSGGLTLLLPPQRRRGRQKIAAGEVAFEQRTESTVTERN